MRCPTAEFKPGDRVRFAYHLRDICGDRGTVVPASFRYPGRIGVESDPQEDQLPMVSWVLPHEIEPVDAVTWLGEVRQPKR